MSEQIKFTLEEINQSEKELAKQLEEKYGKGEIDLESGVFTPVS